MQVFTFHGGVLPPINRDNRGNTVYVSVICENPNVIVESVYLFKLTVITENVILEIVIGVSLLYLEHYGC